MNWTKRQRRIVQPTANVCSGLGLGLGFGGGASLTPMVTAVKAVSAGDRYASGALDFSAITPGTVRARFRIEVAPTSTAFKWIVGHSAAGGGWLLCQEDVNTDGRSALVLYAGLDGALKVVGVKVILPEMVGHVVTVHIVLDGTKCRWYVDGWEAGKGQVTAGYGIAYTAYNQPTAALAMCANSAGSFTGDQSVVEVALSSTQMSATQVATDAAKAVGVAMVGETHRWTAYAALGATWTANTGAINLTRTGSPSISSVASNILKSRGVLNLFGDSVAAGRREDSSAAEGWRRTAQKAAYAAGKGFIFTGSITAGAYPLATGYNDYDSQHNATGGEQLTTRLGTLATNLANVGGPYTSLVLAYGLNDFAAGRTKAQFETDLGTACSTFFATRPNAPRMYIVSCYDPADAASGFTGAGSSQHVQLTSHLANFDALIATLQGTYPRLRGINISALVNDRNNTAQLYDGTHPAAAFYPTIGNYIANVIMNDLPLAA